MNEHQREAICRGLIELGGHYPDMRFGQLVEMVAVLASRDTPETAYDVDDDEFLGAIRNQLTQIARQAAASRAAVVP